MPEIINGVEIPHFDSTRVSEVCLADIVQAIYRLGYLDGYDAGADE